MQTPAQMARSNSVEGSRKNIRFVTGSLFIHISLSFVCLFIEICRWRVPTQFLLPRTRISCLFHLALIGLFTCVNASLHM